MGENRGHGGDGDGNDDAGGYTRTNSFENTHTSCDQVTFHMKNGILAARGRMENLTGWDPTTLDFDFRGTKFAHSRSSESLVATSSAEALEYSVTCEAKDFCQRVETMAMMAPRQVLTFDCAWQRSSPNQSKGLTSPCGGPSSLVKTWS